MQDSVTRMSGLIDSVLDFARGRLGGGVALERVSSDPLVPLLDLIVAGLRTAWPDRTYDHFLRVSRTYPKKVKGDKVVAFRDRNCNVIAPLVSALGIVMSLRSSATLFQW
jgi:hypothetical protein